MVRWQARATAAAAQQLVRVCWYGVHFVQRFSTKSNRSLPLWLGGRSSDGSDELGCGSGSGSRYGGDNRYGSGSSNYGASMWSRGRSLTRATLQTETAPALPGSRRRRRRVVKKKGSTAADMCMRRPLFGLRPVLSFPGHCNAGTSWVKQSLKHCSGNTVGSAYSYLSAAQAACSTNSQCSGVYDSGCDNSGSFYQCDSASLQTSSSSCVYTRSGTGSGSSSGSGGGSGSGSGTPNPHPHAVFCYSANVFPLGGTPEYSVDGRNAGKPRNIQSMVLASVPSQ